MWWRQFVLRQITHWEVGVCVINCRSKTQTKGWRSWRVRRRRDEGMEGWAEAGGGDLQLVELEMLKKLPRQGGERILWQVSVGERQTRRKLERSIRSLFLDICSFFFVLLNLIFSVIHFGHHLSPKVTQLQNPSLWHFVTFYPLLR